MTLLLSLALTDGRHWRACVAGENEKEGLRVHLSFDAQRERDRMAQEQEPRPAPLSWLEMQAHKDAAGKAKRTARAARSAASSVVAASRAAHDVAVVRKMVSRCPPPPPSASDLCSQLAGNSAIYPVKFTG